MKNEPALYVSGVPVVEHHALTGAQPQHSIADNGRLGTLTDRTSSARARSAYRIGADNGDTASRNVTARTIHLSEPLNTLDR